MSESQQNQQEPAAPQTEVAEASGSASATADVGAREPAAIELASDERAPAEATAKPASAHTAMHYLAMAAALTVAVGLGWAGGHAATVTGGPAQSQAHQAILAIDWKGLAGGVQQAQADSSRMAADVQALKGSLAGVKDSIERSKQDAAGRFGQIADRLERGQKSDQDVSSRLTALTERLEKSEREVAAKLTAAVDRLDRMDRQMTAQAGPAKALAQIPTAQVATAPTAAAQTTAADMSLKTGSIAEAKPQEPPKNGARIEQQKAEAKPAAVEGWILREVYDGVALVEGRNKRLVEIAPGEQLAGVGRVESIERRGRAWVVVTTRGLITSQQW